MTVSNDEVDLLELWRAIWSGRWIIAISTGIFILVGATYAFLAQEWYSAEVVLVPAANQQSGAAGSLGELGGLASLVGVSLVNASDRYPVAVLRSREIARGLIMDLNLTPILLEGVHGGSQPFDVRDAVSIFDRRVRSVTEDTRTRLIRLSIQWKDAETAALWANTLARRLNDLLREQATIEAERNIAYLQKEMLATNVVSLQQSIASMLEAEMQKLMLAKGNEEFALRVIDRAVPPVERDSPRRVLIVLVSMLIGFLLATTFVIVRHRVRGESRT